MDASVIVACIAALAASWSGVLTYRASSRASSEESRKVDQ
jgi:hypothetical protein